MRGDPAPWSIPVEKSMTVLVLGGTGMLGRDLVVECQRRGWIVDAPTHTELDLSTNFVIPNLNQYDRVFNCAAYTAVDRAESEPEASARLNDHAPTAIALQCKNAEVPLTHFSTDYVFDGSSPGTYTEDDGVSPLGVYGSTKLAGEIAVLGSGGTVLRTAWLFGTTGHCFPRSILRAWLAGKPLRVVSDQIGNPTYTPDLAWVAAEMVERATPRGLYHAVSPTDMSWHEFACKVVIAYCNAFNIDRPIEIEAISTQEWPTPAPRPARSVLSTAKLNALGIEWPRPINEAISHFVSNVSGITDV